MNEMMTEALSLEMLADLEEDLDHGAKAKRLRRKARKLREEAQAHDPWGEPTVSMRVSR